MDCEKLVQEKTEMQRHYVMVRLLPEKCRIFLILANFCCYASEW